MFQHNFALFSIRLIVFCFGGHKLDNYMTRHCKKVKFCKKFYFFDMFNACSRSETCINQFCIVA